MPKYSYTVINQEGQKLTGTINAQSEKLAQEDLSKLGFPVLDITEIPEEKLAGLNGESQKFEFQAVDQNGRKVVGSIGAEDKYAAFKRLISEYHFAVEHLYLTTLSPDAKDEEKKRGVVDLYAQLKTEQQKAEMAKGAESKIINEEEMAVFIGKQIDTILEKMRNMQEEFKDAIKPEEKTIIGKKIDRLARVKTSKNLEYIKHLAQDLLTYAESQNIFLEKSSESQDMGQSDKKIQSFRLEMKKLLNQIQSEKMSVSLRQDTLNTINGWLDKHINGNNSPASWEKAIGSILTFIANIISEPEEITVLKEKIRGVDKQIWDYYKMYIKENTIEGRNEIKESLRSLKEQKTELKLELAATEHKLAKEVQLAEQETVTARVSGELTSITGWLFAIYFGIHVYTIYSTTRQLPVNIAIPALQISGEKSYLITMLILLVIHGFFRIRSIIILRRALANLILVPTCTFAILLIVFNL